MKSEVALHVLASICFTCGSANLTLLRYKVGFRNCNKLPSKYTVANSCLSANSFSTSSNDESWFEDAQSSSSLTRCFRFVRLVIWLLEMSRTRRPRFSSSPDMEVRALWET